MTEKERILKMALRYEFLSRFSAREVYEIFAACKHPRIGVQHTNLDDLIDLLIENKK